VHHEYGRLTLATAGLLLSIEILISVFACCILPVVLQANVTSAQCGPFGAVNYLERSLCPKRFL